MAARVALVTGASSGIGLRVAETLAALGATVAGFDLAPREGPPLALAYEGDVSDWDAVEACFEAVERELGPVELLVTCAGVFEEGSVLEIAPADWQRVIGVNLTGTFLCARRALPSMRAAGYGRIVTLSSSAGIDGGAEPCAHYAASKGGVIALSKALAKEVAPDGVTVNVVAPRAIRTPMIASLADELAERIPVGRIGEPDDVAAGVAFLCSAHAGYVTGEVFVMNGGWW